MRTWIILSLAALAGWVTWGAAPPADGCCMVPRDYPGDVDQSSQQVVVLHHAGHQELVVRVRPFFREAEETPASLAWLVTTPSKPTAYDTADPAVFDEARALHKRLEAYYDAQEPKPLFPSCSLGAMAPGADAEGKLATTWGVEVDPTVKVGPYTITPVRALGPDAVAGLNRYLEEHGFGTEDPEHLAWFAKHDYTFLCIRITPPEGAVSLGKHLDLVPLRVGFATERPYYPGMYSANQGNFGLELTTITSKPLSRGSLRFMRRKLHAGHKAENLFTDATLTGAFEPVAEAALGTKPAPERWYVNRYDSYGFNEKDAEGVPAILRWKEDVLWALGGEPDLPPSWYYGDGSRPVFHPDNLRRVFWIGLIVGLTTLLWWMIRRRTAPKAA